MLLSFGNSFGTSVIAPTIREEKDNGVIYSSNSQYHPRRHGGACLSVESCSRISEIDGSLYKQHCVDMLQCEGGVHRLTPTYSRGDSLRGGVGERRKG